MALLTKAELNKQNRQFVSEHVEGSRKKDKKDKTGALQSLRGHIKCSAAARSNVLSQKSNTWTNLISLTNFNLKEKSWETCITPRSLQKTQPVASAGGALTLTYHRKQLLIGATNQIFFFHKQFNQRPLEAAVTVCRICQGDTAKRVIQEDFKAMEPSCLLEKI